MQGDNWLKTIPFIIGLILISATANAFLPSHQYRQLLNVSADTDLFGFALQINLTAADVGANFNWDMDNHSINVTDADNNILPCYQEDWNYVDETARVWCNVSLASGYNELYIHYNGTDMYSANNGSKVFLWFWDSTVPIADWDTNNGVTLSGSELYFDSNSEYVAKNLPTTDVRYKTGNWKVQGASDPQFYTYLVASSTCAGVTPIVHKMDNQNNRLYPNYDQDNGQFVALTIGAATYYNVTGAVYADGANWDTNVTVGASTDDYDDADDAGTYICLLSFGGDADSWANYFLVWNYTDVPPTYTFGAEEEAGVSITSWLSTPVINYSESIQILANATSDLGNPIDSCYAEVTYPDNEKQNYTMDFFIYSYQIDDGASNYGDLHSYNPDENNDRNYSIVEERLNLPENFTVFLSQIGFGNINLSWYITQVYAGYSMNITVNGQYAGQFTNGSVLGGFDSILIDSSLISTSTNNISLSTNSSGGSGGGANMGWDTSVESGGSYGYLNVSDTWFNISGGGYSNALASSFGSGNSMLRLSYNSSPTYYATFNNTTQLGNYTITTHCNESAGLTGNDTIQLQVDNPLTVNSQTNSTNVTVEYESVDFTLNVTVEPTITDVNAVLVFNNTEYAYLTKTNSSNSFAFTASGRTPVLESINATVDWYWNITTIVGSETLTTENSETLQIEVYQIVFLNCSNGLANETLRFYILDEELGVQITDSEFEGTFNVSNSYISRLFNFTLRDEGNYSFCLYPIWAQYTVIRGNILYANDTYDNRRYYLIDAAITNTTQSINLYLLKSATSGQVNIQVYDSEYQEKAYVLIKILKEDVGGGTFTEVTSEIADNEGQTIVYLEFDNKYNFIIQENGVTLETFEDILIAGTQPIDKVFVLRETIETPYWDIMETISWSCTNSSDTLTCTFNDGSGLVSTGQLDVDEMGILGSTEACSETVTSSSGTLICTYGDTTGKMFSWAFFVIDSSGSKIVLSSGTIVGIFDETEELGDNGLFLVFVIVLFCGAGIGYLNPTAGIMATIIGLIISYFLGYLGSTIEPGVIGWIILIGAILMYRLRV